MTHRQFLTWRAWMEEQKSVPSKTDWYVIQLTDVVRGLLGKQEKLEKYVLKWGDARKVSREHADLVAKMRWSQHFGINLLEPKTNGTASKP